MKKCCTKLSVLFLLTICQINLYSNLLIPNNQLFTYIEDCELGELSLTKSDCDNDKQFFVTIDFNYANTSDCFTVEGNGVNYGTFLYTDLPIQIGPLNGNCETNYGFVIRDCENEQCAVDKSLGKVCCENPNTDCKLAELEIKKSDCDSNKYFSVTINFIHKNTSDCFTVKGNGKLYGTFKYSNLPIKIDSLVGNCDSNFFFVIRDCENEKCVIEKELGKVCCENPNTDCKLSELQLTKSDCDGDKRFYVTINFDHANTSDCFTVKGNGVNYGTFKYSDLPIKIGPLQGNCETNYGFVIRDCHNEHCVIEKELGKVCCENPNTDCKLSELQLTKSDCDGDKRFYVTINFNHANTSDCFTVKGNGVNYGTFKYSDLPIKIGPLQGNCETNYEFDIRDCHNERCGLEKVLGKVCCENPNTDCKLGELQLTKSDCDGDKRFYVTINFEHKNTSDCFTVKGNGVNYGTFKYSDLPIKIGPLQGNCETNYEFVIRDCHNEKCVLEKVLGKVCCENPNTDCKLSELQLTKSDCDADKRFYVTINFHHANTSDCFTVKGNGVNYGTFKYSDLPIKIGPLQGNCETNYEFDIRDCHNERCGLEKVLGKVCCENPNTDCKLGELQLTKSDCDGDKRFYVTINFFHKNTSDCFTVKGNGVNYGTFKYSDLPIKLGPLNGNCETNYEFVIRDCHNEKCVLEKVLGKVCCENPNTDCKLSELQLTKSDCDGDKRFYVTINFHHANTSDCFTVKGNGVNYGTFKYSDLPIKIGPLNGNCETNYEFVIRDCHNERCAIDKVLGKVCCENPNTDCKIGELELKKSDCESGKFFVNINFFHKNTSDCFTVKGNGVNYGTFKYTDLPIKLGPLNGNCETNYEFVIRDCHNERCGIEKALGKVCCENGATCKVYEVNAIPQECTGKGIYSLKVNFLHSGTGSEFNLYDRNGLIGTYAYANLPLTITDFHKSNLNHDLLKICDKDSPNCCKAVEFKGLECIGAGKSGFRLNGFKTYFDGTNVQLESEQFIPEQIEIELFNVSGSKIAIKSIAKYSQSWQLNTAIHQSGVYVIRVGLQNKYYHYRIFVAK
ncbi:MAG: T9SS type A sorting domain-containing protein [Saprospiraceae bacterium]|nr:T9SS type A sorting domain-containing protein [Saprospiraceae bacterium]